MSATHRFRLPESYRFFLGAIFAVTLPFLAHSQVNKNNFRDLFDGSSLDGWEGSPDYWRVENGTIIGEIPEGEQLKQNHWLIWKDGDVADFELRLKFRLSGNPKANSGIQFRCQATDINTVSGYQADLDQGAMWLGRIYDEHGRKLLVERGTRVSIDETGERQTETFAAKDPFAVLFRENEWNDYHIIASGDSVSVEINGTLFSELIDRQSNEHDPSGQLALQLHSGLHTLVEFKEIKLRQLHAGEHRVTVKPDSESVATSTGIVPVDASGRTLNLGFEEGTLADWTVSNEAFSGQPIKSESVSNKPNSPSIGANGQYLVAGFKDVQDSAVGTLTSTPFPIAHSWASLLVGGGGSRHTQVEIVINNEEQTVVQVFRGRNQEPLRRVFFDLTPHKGKEIFIRLSDQGQRSGAHLNYDDFRFHEEIPPELARATSERVRENPILAHLVSNPKKSTGNGADTVNGMSVSPGFATELIAAEPDLHQPIAFTFDARGRIWVIEAHSYPTKRAEGEGLDKIVIFEDQDGDGEFESRKIFAEGINLASGIEVGHGGVWVGAAPELLFIPDRDGNDIPDTVPVVLLDGFGYQDTHETMNSFTWGPDGWLYGNQGIFNYAMIGKPGASNEERISLSAGVWRYHPIRHEFEIFGHGGSNPWGLDFNEMGQLFMTHCRSRWGGGPTTLISQGGHYWNQANRGHAPFVSGQAPQGFDVFRNYMMASARYGHGEGGAGKSGSRAVYGGHSLVGTMIYLGDNWPAEYRGHLFSHNLHGHQLNHQINLPEGSGYNTIHAGSDLLYSPDPAYIPVELKYGPDGAVYFTDWVDMQHCHNPNSEQWDRGNGRLYRMSWAESFKPVKVDLESATDSELVDYQLHTNDWYVRTARRLLNERASQRDIDSRAIKFLRKLASESTDASRRLRALWALHAIGELDNALGFQLLRDENQHVRAWAIQLIVENREFAASMSKRFIEMAATDPSPVVRLYLASAIQRVDPETGWSLSEGLLQRGEDASDRYIPKMLWYGLAPLMETDPDRAIALIRKSSLPTLSSYANWYAAKLQGDSLDRVIAELETTNDQSALIEAIALGLNGQFGLSMPPSWPKVSKELYSHTNQRVAKLALDLGSLFDDTSIYPGLRATLAEATAPIADRTSAFSALANALNPETIDLFVSLLDDPNFRVHVIRLSPRLNQSDIADRLIQRFDTFNKIQSSAALNALTQKESMATALLDAMKANKIDRSLMTAYYARALSNLKSPLIDEKLALVWGKVNATPEATQNRIDQLETSYAEAPLWAFRTLSGQAHFEALCSACHQPSKTDANIGPNLNGSGPNGARYFLENIIDPNAVVGSDYAISTIKTKSGQTLSGILDKQTETAVTLKTIADSTTIPRSDIASISESPQSMMPPGLLDTLNDREITELIKYLETL